MLDVGPVSKNSTGARQDETDMEMSVMTSITFAAEQDRTENFRGPVTRMPPQRICSRARHVRTLPPRLEKGKRSSLARERRGGRAAEGGV